MDSGLRRDNAVQDFLRRCHYYKICLFIFYIFEILLKYCIGLKFGIIFFSAAGGTNIGAALTKEDSDGSKTNL
jgi:hypothetical protein